MILDVDTPRDFSKYYGERYLKGRDGQPYFLRSASSEDIQRNRLTFYRPKSKTDEWRTEVVQFEDLGTRFLFGLYRLGTIAYKDELLYFSYLPTRDGGRGLDLRRIVCHSFNSLDLAGTGNPTFSLEAFGGLVAPTEIRSLLFPERKTFVAAIAALSEGTALAVATVDPSYGVYQSRFLEHPSLTYKKSVIGSFRDGAVSLFTAPKIPYVGLLELLDGVDLFLPDGTRV